jgi:hypothetical protein
MMMLLFVILIMIILLRAMAMIVGLFQAARRISTGDKPLLRVGALGAASAAIVNVERLAAAVTGGAAGMVIIVVVMRPVVVR